MSVIHYPMLSCQGVHLTRDGSGPQSPLSCAETAETQSALPSAFQHIMVQSLVLFGLSDLAYRVISMLCTSHVFYNPVIGDMFN